MAIVTELSPSAGERECRWEWHPAEARTTRPGSPVRQSDIAGFAKQYGSHYQETLKLHSSNPAGRLEKDGAISVWIQDLVAGGQYATAWTEQARKDTRTHIVSIANSHPDASAATTARSDVDHSVKLGREDWVQSHRDWWHSYYKRSFITLPDKGLESLYWQTVYRLGCTSRAGRCMVDTPGIWFQGTSWPYFTTDCNFDLALFKWGCHTLLKACMRLQIDDPLIPRWKEVIARLSDYPADDHGFMLGSNASSSANHQHFSNLLMIYPLHLVNIEQPGTADVLRRSFERAWSTAGPGQRQAMVQAHAGPIGTAIGLADEALESLRRLQGDLYPNGLWYESPCIESTLAAANIVQDMLIQSWSDPAKEDAGPTRIFPALPSAWKDLEFHDLLTEGAFLVSAKRSKGRTQWVRIKSLAGEPCRVMLGIVGEVRTTSGRPFHLQTIAPGVLQIDLREGEEVWLHQTARSSISPPP